MLDGPALTSAVRWCPPSAGAFFWRSSSSDAQNVPTRNRERSANVEHSLPFSRFVTRSPAQGGNSFLEGARGLREPHKKIGPSQLLVERRRRHEPGNQSDGNDGDREDDEYDGECPKHAGPPSFVPFASQVTIVCPLLRLPEPRPHRSGPHARTCSGELSALVRFVARSSPKPSIVPTGVIAGLAFVVASALLGALGCGGVSEPASVVVDLRTVGEVQWSMPVQFTASNKAGEPVLTSRSATTVCRIGSRSPPGRTR
jgi:hypothetical protein